MFQSCAIVKESLGSYQGIMARGYKVHDIGAKINHFSTPEIIELMEQGHYVRKIGEVLDECEFSPIQAEVIASNNRNLWEEYEITFAYIYKSANNFNEWFVQFHPNAPAIPLRTALVYAGP